MIPIPLAVHIPRVQPSCQLFRSPPHSYISTPRYFSLRFLHHPCPPWPPLADVPPPPVLPIQPYCIKRPLRTIRHGVAPSKYRLVREHERWNKQGLDSSHT